MEFSYFVSDMRGHCERVSKAEEELERVRAERDGFIEHALGTAPGGVATIEKMVQMISAVIDMKEASKIK